MVFQTLNVGISTIFLSHLTKLYNINVTKLMNVVKSYFNYVIVANINK